MSSLAEIVNGIIDDEVCDEIVNAMKERINVSGPNRLENFYLIIIL